MPTLTGLHIYPIKSCAGLSLDRARLTPWGLEWDRHWMVVDVNDTFVSQRTYPDMARIVPSFEGDVLVLRTDGMPDLELPLAAPADAPNAARLGAPTSATVDAQTTGSSDASVDASTVEQVARPTHALHDARHPTQPDLSPDTRIVSVWDDAFPAIDVGEAAARWFSQRFGSTLRVVRFDPSMKRRVSKKWTGDYDAVTQFADGFPMLVTGEASLAELNGRLAAKGAPTISMNRFRPNIVISGLEPYDEDFIDTLTIGGSDAVVLRMSKPCARCPIPTINQSDGSRDAEWPHEPLETLATYRANPLVNGGLTFGQNAIAIQGVGQWIEVGAPIETEWNFV